MVYGRRYRKNKKSFRRYKRKNFRKSVAKIAKKTITSFAEKKYKDLEAFNLADVAAYDQDEVELTSFIGQGSNDTSRVGDSLRLTSLEIRGTVYQQQGDQPSRLLIIKYKPGSRNLDASSTANVDLNQIFQQGASNICVEDHFSKDLRNRFVVLYDRTFDSSVTQVGSGSAGNCHFHKVIPLRNTEVTYDAGTGRTSKNAIICYWMSDDTVVNNTGMYMKLNTRLRFTDT